MTHEDFQEIRKIIREEVRDIVKEEVRTAVKEETAHLATKEDVQLLAEDFHKFREATKIALDYLWEKMDKQDSAINKRLSSIESKLDITINRFEVVKDLVIEHQNTLNYLQYKQYKDKKLEL